MLTKGQVKWGPGEHAFFTLPGKEISGRKWRTFSIASVEDEGHMLIGLRTGKHISSFKEQLINMHKGEKVGVRGPFGGFDLSDKAPLVLIASGVGVTPIRGILQELKNESRPVEVVFTSSNYHLFKEELEAFSKANQSINLSFLEGKEATQIMIKKLANIHGSNARYYISGSIPVIKSLKTLLKKSGVDKRRVINDPFYGY